MPTDNGADHPAAAAASTRRRLPLSWSRSARGCYYVDKTAFIARVVDEGKHYFLSRPRRSGKTLLVDTIKELFESSEPLFPGLAVPDACDWTASHPVVRLSFGLAPERGPYRIVPAPEAAYSSLRSEWR